MSWAPSTFFGPGVRGTAYGSGAGGIASYSIDPDFALAQQRLQSDGENLRLQLDAQRGQQERQLAGDRLLAQMGADTDRYRIGTDADTVRRGQDLTFQTQSRGLDNAAQADRWNFDAAMRNADVADAGNRLQSDTTRFTAQLGADTAREGNRLQYDAANRGNELQAQTAQRGQDLSFRASMAPVEFARDRFNSVLPMFQTALAGGGDAERVGGQNTPTPGVTVGGVYSPQQVDEQVNAARARNAEETATQQRLAREQGAARGMSSRSPLAAALDQRFASGRMAADADAERQIRFDAAGANARQQTASEGLRGQLWNQENALDIQRRQTAQQGRNALLAALAGFAG